MTGEAINGSPWRDPTFRCSTKVLVSSVLLCLLDYNRQCELKPTPTASPMESRHSRALALLRTPLLRGRNEIKATPLLTELYDGARPGAPRSPSRKLFTTRRSTSRVSQSPREYRKAASPF